MKKGKLLITEHEGSFISMLIGADGKTVRINAETESRKSQVGNIYAGNVTDIVKGINAAFVEFEDGQRGFLQLSDTLNPIFLNRNRKPGPIRQGDIILVQITGDRVRKKDAVISTRISIAGKYAVLSSDISGVRFSVKLGDSELKSRILEQTGSDEERDFGFIVRTAAKDADISLIAADMKRLEDAWRDVLSSAEGRKRGMVLERRLFYLDDVISFVSDIDEIVTDDTTCYLNIKKMLEERYPEDLGKLRAYNGVRIQMKTVYGFQSRMDEALQKNVNLKSGAFLVIEPTEALIAIDVNSGKAEKPDFLKINLEAAKEVARQLRLRNLSGMIIVDFISMRSKEDNETLMSAMREYMKDDPMKPKAVDMTALGLLEITRKKVRRPLYEILDI